MINTFIGLSLFSDTFQHGAYNEILLYCYSSEVSTHQILDTMFSLKEKDDLHVLSPFLHKGCNFHDFLFASLDDVPLLKVGHLLKERICS